MGREDLVKGTSLLIGGETLGAIKGDATIMCMQRDARVAELRQILSFRSISEREREKRGEEST